MKFGYLTNRVKGAKNKCWSAEPFLLFFRKAVEPGDDSKWTPILAKIISDTQEICKKLYHGVLELE